MSKAPGRTTIEDACSKVEGMDIFNNTAAQQVFCKIAIDYSRAELRRDGIDLFTVGTHAELHSYCRLWLKEHPGLEADVGLIGLSQAIQSNAHAFVRAARASKGPENPTS